MNVKVSIRHMHNHFVIAKPTFILNAEETFAPNRPLWLGVLPDPRAIFCPISLPSTSVPSSLGGPSKGPF